MEAQRRVPALMTTARMLRVAAAAWWGCGQAATEEHVEAAIAGEAEEDAASVVEVDEKEAAESAGAQVRA